jgi:hypothetical protein
VSNLRGYDYRVIAAVDEEEALERGADGNVPADLVLVNLVSKSAGEVNAGRKTTFAIPQMDCPSRRAGGGGDRVRGR